MSYLYNLVRDDLGEDAVTFMMEDLRLLERQTPMDDCLDIPAEARKHFHILIWWGCEVSHSNTFCTVGGARCSRDANKLQTMRHVIVNVEALEQLLCVKCLKEMQDKGTNSVKDEEQHYEWSLSKPFKAQARGTNLSTGIKRIYISVEHLFRHLERVDRENGFGKADNEGSRSALANYWYDGRTCSGANDKNKKGHPPEVCDGWNANTLVLSAAWQRAEKRITEEYNAAYEYGCMVEKDRNEDESAQGREVAHALP